MMRSSSPEYVLIEASVTNIRDDEAAWTTFLTARAARWADVAGNFEIDFGKALPAKNSLGRRMLRPRDEGTINHSFEINAGKPGRFNILPGARSYVIFK